MTAARQDEVERKYEPALQATLPDLTACDGVVAVAPPVEFQLEAVYFDTPDLDLARRRVTLRRRTGGHDAGWHLKLPAEQDTRTELHLPLGRSGSKVPRQLVDPVRAFVRDRSLQPVARISTRRREHRLLGDGDTVLAIVSDDEVHGERLAGTTTAQRWREWEVELVDGVRALLDAVEPRLVAAGAASASVSSKLARTLGDALPTPVGESAPTDVANGTTAELLRSVLAQQVAELHQQDARLRTGGPGSVHKLRIAARRLRSTLTTYRPLLDPAVADPLREELRWLGQMLSRARDAQVLRQHLQDVVAGEPPELVLGRVVERIDAGLDVEYRSGVAQAQRSLRSERYFRLLDCLDELAATLPVTADADTAARDLAPRLLQRDAKKLRRAVRDVDSADDLSTRDPALHEARKKAKRLRYAAESLVPMFGRRAKALARAAERIQESLGVHQDSVVARTRLREFAVRAHRDGENGFTFGRLHALEQWRGQEAERDFDQAWAQLPRKNLGRWIRR